ncbi:MAG: hypothetical protein HDR01_02900 [Lachnospiraceae bacterium]|nr:hypothetical protein [Lachnospiraceae bacterium]
MEDLDKELLKWAEAPREIEEETRKMVQSRHRLWVSFLEVLGAIVMGLINAKAGGFGICISIFCFLAVFVVVLNYYEDERYLKRGITKEKIRVKTVLLHEVITKYTGSRYSPIDKYLKISYHMGDEKIVRETRYFNYDIGLLGHDLVGLYGKKITVVYYNKEFYILNHVYLEFDEEELKAEERTESLKNPETAVRNLVESKDEKQIIRKRLEEEFKHQRDYKMAEYLLILFLFVDGVIGCMSLCFSGMHGIIYVMAGGFTIFMLGICFMEWVSCRKHSGRIWSKAKLRKVNEELERGRKIIDKR